MSNLSASGSRPGVPASISAQFTLYFDGRFWVGVLECRERHHGGDVNGQAITVRAARHVFGAEPSDVELYDFLLARGGELIDRAAASPPVSARARPSTAAQAALAAAREETAARTSRNRSLRRRQEADEAWARRRERAKRRHRGR